MTLSSYQDDLVFAFDFDFGLQMLTFFRKYREHSSLLQKKVYPYMK